MCNDLSVISSDKKFAFRRLRVSSVETYSNHLHCLVFNALRFYCRTGWTTKYRYPDLDPSQLACLQNLSDALDQPMEAEIDDLFHQVCYILFAHQKHQYPASRALNNFFSPVICFLVLHCLKENGGTPDTSGISNVVAPIMYSIRACVLKKVLAIRTLKGISAHEYVFAHQLSIYLIFL